MKPNCCSAASSRSSSQEARGSPPGSADVFAAIDPFRLGWGAEVYRRSVLAEDSQQVAVRPGCQRVDRCRRSRLDPAAALYARAARKRAGCAAGARVRRRRKFPSRVGRSRSRLRLARFGARHLHRSQAVRLDRRQRSQGPSDSEIHERRKVRDADRKGRPEQGQRRYAEPESAGRHVRPCEDERALRRRRLRQQAHHRVRCGHGKVQAYVGGLRQSADG